MIHLKGTDGKKIAAAKRARDRRAWENKVRTIVQARKRRPKKKANPRTSNKRLAALYLVSVARGAEANAREAITIALRALHNANQEVRQIMGTVQAHIGLIGRAADTFNDAAGELTSILKAPMAAVQMQIAEMETKLLENKK